MDKNIALLIDHLQQQQQHSLWFADESQLDAIPVLASFRERLSVMTNRFDIFQACKTADIDTYFCDADFSLHHLPIFKNVYLRISKEKALVHTLINASYRHLPTHGQLILAGGKSEGIKTYSKKAAVLFHASYNAQKHKDVYVACYSKEHEPDSQTPWLDDNHYHQLREIATFEHGSIYSKPGLYGWNKIDQGSAFLIEHLPKILDSTIDMPPEDCLDLGCGYGYLTLFTCTISSIKKRVATDNHIAAVNACKKNTDLWGLNTQCITDDAGQTIDVKFDLVLCNPPFHKGFSIESDLTRKFIARAARLVAAKGVAVFVVNAFIAIEPLAEQHFTSVKIVQQNKQFKILALKHRP